MTAPLRRIRAGIVLTGIFLWDLVAASCDVARIVLSPRMRTSPRIVVVPIALTRPAAIALFAYFVSLTPGSTCLHVSRDRTRLFVHILDTDDDAATIARFKSHFERWIAELLE
ncbi:sodium:proton antiporter [Sphingomonas sp. Leaf33]|uniref:Na+/H+ antiporter subunit E n=1 Tax=Sphingomonas sp. Leaf33 TaxID=1736215 RepID=UPI0006FE7FD8|nr:Na+/H+ antiporter subunit E [Sphingomonas sp. Leaf33]KQN26624.1 sodium:proton antiporter [Sphingomonas sp. Leaf33]